MNKLAWITITGMLCLAASAHALDIEVDAAERLGPIKRDIAGLSQGGNGSAMADAAVRGALRGLPVGLVRVEGVTGSTPFYAGGQWDFPRLADEIRAIRAAGGEPLVNFFYTPKSMSSSPDGKNPWFAPPADPQAYAGLCGRIVHYLNHDLKLGVKYFEFWNEPSGNWFWTEWRTNRDGFFRQYQLVYDAVKAADPSALVGGMADNADYLSNYTAWYDHLRKNNGKADFLTIHWYGEWRRDKTVPARARRLGELAAAASRQFKDALGHAPAKCFITEWGLIAEAKESFPPAQVGAYIAQALAVMQNAPDVDGACYFRVKNYRPNSALFDKDWKPQVVWRVLDLFARLPDEQVRAVLPGDDDVTALAAAGPAGRCGALVARYAPGQSGALNATVRFKGLEADRQYRIVRLTLDAASPEAPLRATATEVTGRDAKAEVPLEPFAVAYVAAEPLPR